VYGQATSYARVKQMKFEAINGPTYQEQPVFAWTSQWDAYSHVGQPLRFHFPFVTMQPAQFQ
jgi:hypothetical protein